MNSSSANSTPQLNESLPPKWIVLHTKSRQEKAVARHLKASGCVFDLPLIERTTMSHGRKHQSEVPLFSGYVFLKGEKQEAYDAMATKRVCNIIEVKDQTNLEHELALIHHAIQSGLPIQEYPQIAIGTRCRVKSGPLKGVEGIVIKEARRTCLILHVETLGRGASVEIEQDLLQPVD